MSCLPKSERRLVDSVVMDLRVRVARALDRALIDCTSEQREIAKKQVLAEFDNVGLHTGEESSDRPVFSAPESDSVSVDVATQPDLPSPSPFTSSASDVPSDLAPALATEAPPTSLASHSDSHILALLTRGRVKHRVLETHLAPDFPRAVMLRRQFLASRLAHSPRSIERIPTRSLDYSQVVGACCENVIGYTPIPLGIVGPLVVNGRRYFVPLATTEGALVASTNRGCQAIVDGVFVRVFHDGMTRSPVLQFPNVCAALQCKDWLDSSGNFQLLKTVFDATSSFLNLITIDVQPDGRLLFLRFHATTGDAMGMNMVTKAVRASVEYLKQRFPQLDLLSLSGNFCADKKATAVNWVRGRGKSVIAEARVCAKVVETRLHTTVDRLIRLGVAKLQIGTSLASGIGANNAHAANIVAAIFLATGQDCAQVISSGMCSTHLECREPDGDLFITCTMRCLEVGTVGGGTMLPAQRAALEMLDCAGPAEHPGDNARRLAEIICATVLAGELSLLAAQCSDDLVSSHLRLNRSSRSLVPAESASRGLSVSLMSRSSGDKVKIECSNIL